MNIFRVRYFGRPSCWLSIAALLFAEQRIPRKWRKSRKEFPRNLTTAHLGFDEYTADCRRIAGDSPTFSRGRKFLWFDGLKLAWLRWKRINRRVLNVPETRTSRSILRKIREIRKDFSYLFSSDDSLHSFLFLLFFFYEKFWSRIRVPLAARRREER